MRPTLPLLLLALALAAPAAAQQTLPPGSPVRVDAGEHRGVFTLVRSEPDALVLRTRDGAGELRVPNASVRSLSVARGRVPAGRSALRGAGYGLLIGGGLGAVAGFSGGDDSGACYVCFSAEEKALLGGSVGGVAGAVVGAVTGALARPHRWERVHLSPDVTGGVSVTPHDGGVAVGVRLRW